MGLDGQFHEKTGTTVGDPLAPAHPQGCVQTVGVQWTHPKGCAQTVGGQWTHPKGCVQLYTLLEVYTPFSLFRLFTPKSVVTLKGRPTEKERKEKPPSAPSSRGQYMYMCMSLVFTPPSALLVQNWK